MKTLVARRPQEFAVPEVERHPQPAARLVPVAAVAVICILIDGTSSATITAGLAYEAGRSAATPDESSWFVTAFNAPYYATILLSPWLYARFGRKPLLLAGLIGYAVSSVLLALVSGYDTSVALRFIQGLFLGCVYVPAALLLLTAVPLAVLPRVVPFFTFSVLSAAVLGTLIGGYLVESFGAWALYAPTGIVAFGAAALLWRFAPSYDEPQPKLRFDALGFALSLIAFAAAQYLANEGERRNWFDSDGVIWAVVILALAVPAFVASQLIGARPHTNLRLFARYRNLLVGSGINMVLGASGYAVTLFSIYLQSEVFATITLAGALIALRVVTYAVGIFCGFILLSRRLLDVRIILGAATITSAVALYGFAYNMTPTAEAATFIDVTLIFGFFFAILSQPVPALVIGGLPLGDLPAGIAVYKLTVPIGLMIGTGLLGTLIDHRTTLHASEIAGNVTLARPPIDTLLSDGHSALLQLSAVVTGQAQDVAYQDGMIVMCIMMLLVVPLALFVVPPRPAPPPPPAE
jgi:MFS transporter, DHA2 family, multidrug resistance protein